MKANWELNEVARLLGIGADDARELARAVFGEERQSFGFQDLVSLRAGKALSAAKAPSGKVREALAKLSSSVDGSTVVGKRGREVVLEQGSKKWNAATGQELFDFGGNPMSRLVNGTSRAEADRLFARAASLEEQEPANAVELYTEAIAIEPGHADAHVNLGRLHHTRGRLREAEAHYVAALVARPRDVTATFNLAVVLEDLGKIDESISRYTEVLELDPRCVDACFNLSRLYEKKGNKVRALRHLKDYRSLTRTVR